MMMSYSAWVKMWACLSLHGLFHTCKKAHLKFVKSTPSVCASSVCTGWWSPAWRACRRGDLDLFIPLCPQVNVKLWSWISPILQWNQPLGCRLIRHLLLSRILTCESSILSCYCCFVSFFFVQHSNYEHMLPWFGYILFHITIRTIQSHDLQVFGFPHTRFWSLRSLVFIIRRPWPLSKRSLETNGLLTDLRLILWDNFMGYSYEI